MSGRASPEGGIRESIPVPSFSRPYIALDENLTAYPLRRCRGWLRCGGVGDAKKGATRGSVARKLGRILRRSLECYSIELCDTPTWRKKRCLGGALPPS